jgi:hypothetical protein
LILRHGVLPSLPTAACASLHSPEISAGSALSGFDFVPLQSKPPPKPLAPSPRLPPRLRVSASRSIPQPPRDPESQPTEIYFYPLSSSIHATCPKSRFSAARFAPVRVLYCR